MLACVCVRVTGGPQTSPAACGEPLLWVQRCRVPGAVQMARFPGTVRATHWQGGGVRLGARELAGRQALLPSQGRRGLLLPRGSDGCFESLPVASHFLRCHVRLRLCTRRDCLKAGVSTLECHGGPSKEMQSGVQMPLQMSGMSGRWPDVGVTQSSSLTATG